MSDNNRDVSWVKPFIHNLFSGNSSDADKYMNEKMQYINKPFYKYCYVCEESKRAKDTIDYNIDNFENDELFFQDPSLFNDPFDCYLGFSQAKLIKDLLVQEMKKQKRYSQDMRKAIEAFFAQETDEQVDWDSIDVTAFKGIVEATKSIVTASLGSDDKSKAYLSQMMDAFLEEKKLSLFKKLVQNKLTVKDQQEIIDFLYGNEAFREFTKPSLENPESSDWILKMAQHDMKLKVETHPDSFHSGEGTESFQLFDFLQMLINATIKDEKLSELSEIKKKFKELSDSTMQKSRALISEQCRVTCLSERMDSPLMWSHYANKHFGFCLEYDFTHSMIICPDLMIAKTMLLPVVYSDKRPLLSDVLSDPKERIKYIKTKKLPSAMLESIVYGLLFKSVDWSYEQEWRIIGIGMEKPTMKLPKARKLFLGANIEEKAKQRLIDIAKKKHIPIYQMILSSDKYKFEYYKID